MFIFREAIQKFCLADENFVSFLAHCAKVLDPVRNGRKIPQASANAGLRCGGVHMVFQIGRLAGAEEGMKKFRTARRARWRQWTEGAARLEHRSSAPASCKKPYKVSHALQYLENRHSKTFFQTNAPAGLPDAASGRICFRK